MNETFELLSQKCSVAKRQINEVNYKKSISKIN